MRIPVSLVQWIGTYFVATVFEELCITKTKFSLRNFFRNISKVNVFHYRIVTTFKTSLDELVSKKIDIAYKIIHLVLKYQKLGDVTFIHDAFVKIVNRKIIYYGLQELQPNFLGNTKKRNKFFVAFKFTYIPFKTCRFNCRSYVRLKSYGFSNVLK